MTSQDNSRTLHSINFEHSHRGITATLQLDVNSTSAGPDVMDIIIKSNQGKLLGYINGWWRSEYYEVSFYSIAASNLQRTTGKGEVLIPRVVGASIAQLVQEGLVGVWHSSPIELLSDHAVDMYGRYLASQSQLIVAPPNSYHPNYVVTKKA